ncbi:MAG: cysteine--tRNA ligase [Patescibacteria group bacterium]|nr:cysteine--tRNA ligase [Patescibacteria group bacterium]MDE1944035.1 cysteine--tRNA ligase [Patescibacteria group bacterium]MDE1945194.1 cysteine--tRNA ligase [Patescibacteria group bacterium]MDE2057710.1 cysteine--tRNA ligase [Patescibacteria group bacterium]
MRLPFFSRAPRPAPPPRILLTNTLSGGKELFIPLKAGQVSLYTCGPTVYNRASIGNLRPYVFSDTLARTLAAAGYRVRRVINITDVGHLVSDADQGEDKMNVGAKREGTTPEAIAERYMRAFIEDLGELDIDTSAILFPRATEYIREQIAMAKTLEEKGFAYRAADGLYFDTSRFAGYGKLGNLAGVELKEGARVAPAAGKRHGADFALWRFAKPGDLQQWDSPWGRGNPGWHIECSAMSRALLGDQLDIHTGGEDHIAIHHNDEIAQSEAASGRAPFVRYWLHNAFLTFEGEKISKSLGNVFYLSDLKERGYHPLALRYFFLQAHYKTPVSFSWSALAAADAALGRLWKAAREVRAESRGKAALSPARDAFLARMRDDLATPAALGVLWEAVKSEDYSPAEKWGLLEDAEAHLGLRLTDPPARAAAAAPEEVRTLVDEREGARARQDWAAADRLRDEIAKRGYRVDDGPAGPVLTEAS